MKKILFGMLAAIFLLCGTIKVQAQGWPQNYGGVMLQGFYWDSYGDSQWASLEKQADDLASSFDLVWIPQSGNCGGTSMGYDDLWWFNNYNSTFGTEAELRSMIKTFKEKGIGTIADVVINHRKNMSNWVDFPKETYKGVTYEMTSTDICADDDGGKTNTWANQNGYSLSSNNDTGEGWDGMRDLDHKSKNVQDIVKAYLDFLLNDLGYTGFRYDMVKGYSASYTGLYNTSANVNYSVGEYWDGNASKVKSWINGTKVDDKIQSAAFDFPFRYTVRNALRGSTNDNNTNNWKQNPDYRLLSSTSIMSDADYRQYAVTFVENHDTEYRSSTAQQDPIRKDTLAANAFLLAMPGTPCVFLKHWLAYKSEIKAMIEARKLAGITNTSAYSNFRNNTNYFANVIKVNGNNKLLVVVGDEKYVEPSNSQWTKILSGYHYAYYLTNDMETAWADKGSGEFKEAFDITLTAVSNTADAKLVYTLDGSEPSATNGTQVASGSSIKIEGEKDVTLKVGLLIGSAVSGIITRTFIYKEEEKLPEAVCIVNEGEVCAFFEAPANWDKTIYCWAWNNSPGENFTYANGGWPGVACQLLGVAENGNKVWKWTWDGTKQNNTSVEKPGMIIFSNFGSPQTADLTFQVGGYYNEKELQKTISKISAINFDNNNADKVYRLDGRLVSTEGNMDKLPKGVYILNKKKIIVK